MQFGVESKIRGFESPSGQLIIFQYRKINECWNLQDQRFLTENDRRFSLKLRLESVKFMLSFFEWKMEEVLDATLFSSFLKSRILD
jgi:hypothetical protein